MKVSSILQFATAKILLLILEKGDVRYGDLARLIPSRGTLSLNVKELEEEGLVQRRVVASKPIEAHYSLTDKGRKVALRFKEISAVFKSA